MKQEKELKKSVRYVRLVADNAIHYDDCLGEIETLHNVRKTFDAPLVDESYYVSSTDRARQVKSANGAVDKSAYDFPDGTISFNAEKVAEIRRPGHDISEISKMVKETANDANRNLKNDVEKYRITQEINAKKAVEQSKAVQDAMVNSVKQSIQKTSKD